MRCLTLAIVLASASPVFAQAPGETPPAPAVERESLFDAYLVTVAGVSLPMVGAALIAGDESSSRATTVAGVIGLATLVLGPSAGHWYAGETITTGLVIRASSIAAIGALAVADPHLDHVGTIFGLLGAVAGWETGMVWDLVTLPRAVRHWNTHQLQLAPVVVPGQGAIAGLGLGGRF